MTILTFAREICMTASDYPLWRQIADTLKDEAAALMPGDQFPTEARLSARFGVNRHTVRRALAALAEEGVVHARRGAGVFVAARPTEYPLSRRVRFHAALNATGRVPGRRVLSVETQPATAREAEVLNLPEATPVLCVEGLTMSDGVVIGHFRSALPKARLPGLETPLREGKGMTESFRLCGIEDYTRAWTRLTARTADGLLAGHLQLKPGAAVMRAESLNLDPEGRPLEYGIAHFAGERVTLTVAPEG